MRRRHLGIVDGPADICERGRADTQKNKMEYSSLNEMTRAIEAIEKKIKSKPFLDLFSYTFCALKIRNQDRQCAGWGVINQKRARLRPWSLFVLGALFVQAASSQMGRTLAIGLAD